MSDSVKIEIKLASQWHNDPPVFAVKINDELIERGFVKEKDELGEIKSITWTGDLEESEHTLKVCLRGKNIGKWHTIKDANDNVIDDQLLFVKSILIDDIDLGYIAISNSKFYPDKSNRSDAPELIDGGNVLGYNGEWCLTFSVPTYMWMLEKF